VSPGDLLALLLGAGAGFAIGRFARRRPGDAADDGTPVQPPVLDSRFEQLVASLDAGIVTLDGRGAIASINDAAVAIFGLEGKAAAGKALIEVVPSFDLDRRVRDALEGTPWRGDLHVNVPPRARRLTVAALPLKSGGALVIASDETRLHELEQMRRDFVSNVSHELRTPLSSINLMIETILTTDLDEEALRLFLPRVKQEVDRMAQLVQDLLDIARAEAGRLPLRIESFDLAAVATKITTTLEPRATQLGVTLRHGGESAWMSGDADRLAQILVNLIDNALRHTPPGGSVDVEVHANEGSAILTVRDTGDGIPYSDLPHIFERFYVVDRSRSRESAGTGLGLSIVKHLVQAHGGTVSVDSELGFGATFTCAFPALPAPASAVPANPAS
jgi:two-component system phosphate regulon sensor histidine kinase PhoR